MIKPGDKIPEVLGEDQDGKLIKAAELLGQPFVLYFYPKDMTFGCTAEACSIRDSWPELQGLGIRVIGVSKDSKSSHQKFRAAEQLPFTLIADTDHQLQDAFGVWVQKKMYGRTYWGTERTSFVIDAKGVVKAVMRAKEIKTKEHGKQLMQLIESLDLK